MEITEPKGKSLEEMYFIFPFGFCKRQDKVNILRSEHPKGNMDKGKEEEKEK